MMDPYFKDKLLDMLSDKSRASSQIQDELEYQKMINYGVYAESGDKYFLFVYRDFFRKKPYYGATLFLNKRNTSGSPISIYGLEENGREQVRKIYVLAAVFFLKKGFANTLTLLPQHANILEWATKKINDILQVSRSSPDTLDNFSYDLNHPIISCEEIKDPPPAIPSNTTPEWRAQFYPKESESNTQADLRLNARLGLRLTEVMNNLIQGVEYTFQPVIFFPQGSRKGSSPREVTGEDFTKYQLEDTNPLILEFARVYGFLQDHSRDITLKTKLSRYQYFPELLKTALLLPRDLLRYQSQGGIDHPLAVITFRALEIQFAPVLDRKNQLTFYLTLITQQGERIDALDRFKIITSEDQTILIIQPQSNISLLACPDSLDHFFSLFRLLLAKRDFYSGRLNQMRELLTPILNERITLIPEPLKKYHFKLFPIPIINIHPAQSQSSTVERMELEFDYKTPLLQYLLDHPDHKIYSYDREELFENLCQKLLSHDPLLHSRMSTESIASGLHQYHYFKDGSALKWLVEMGRLYMEKGFKIFNIAKGRYIRGTGSTMQISYHRDSQWLELTPLIQKLSGDKALEIIEVDLAQQTVVDKQGDLHLVTPEELNKLKRLLPYCESDKIHLRIPNANFLLINSLHQEKLVDVEDIESVNQRVAELDHFKEIPHHNISRKFKGKLRHYQQSGVNWLKFLRQFRFSGCLADDMGLGKTVQTLAFLQSLQTTGELGTCLLVVPVSAVYNWENEILRFTPVLTYLTHLGPNRMKNSDNWNGVNLIITSYATLRNDVVLFGGFPFDTIILDESQNIKNHTSLTAKAVKSLQSEHRLALSGTPVENSSLELWSLFDFLLPGYLGSHQWYSHFFLLPIEQDRASAKVELLRQMVYPFLLRRTKEQVESELPAKVEVVSRLTMSEEQAQVYGQVARGYLQELNREVEERGVKGVTLRVLEGMLRLRQICILPGLVKDELAQVPSVKFAYLEKLIEKIASGDHKVLVFSQFVQVLKQLGNHLLEAGFSYLYMDGSLNVAARKQVIDQFQQDESQRIFLVSLKAGGVALNLTAADYVVLLDPWWNPSVEAQAIDRTHRIGQTKKVIVYRLLTRGTIEEKMHQLQQKKKKLVDNLIQVDEKALKKLSKKDIIHLFESE